MPNPSNPPIPAHRIAVALDTVLITPGQHFHLGVAQAAWSDLKEARGQQVNFSRLAPAHIVERTAQPPLTLTQELDAATARTSQVVRKLRQSWFSGPSDLGGAA
ncbi:MAG: hypothetical protein ACK4MS_10560 [Paracoccaceae bacterium]